MDRQQEINVDDYYDYSICYNRFNVTIIYNFGLTTIQLCIRPSVRLSFHTKIYVHLPGPFPVCLSVSFCGNVVSFRCYPIQYILLN